MDIRDLPSIPTYPEFTSMIEAGDVVELHYMRQLAIYYKALVEGYAAGVARKNEETERLRDFIAGVKPDE